MKGFTISKTELLPNSEALIEGELSAETVQKERNTAIQAFQSKISLDGFRKGHIPEKILIEKVGELSIYEDAAARALEKEYQNILKEAGIDSIGNPRVSITKISPGMPVGFKIETAVMPKINLPDYKKLAKEVAVIKEEVDIEEKEVDQALDDMRRSFAHHQKHHHVDSKDKPEPHDDHTGKDIPEGELPVLDDEFAKKLAGLENLDTLKAKIRESILNEKKVRAKEKKRISIIEKILEKTEISIPEILAEGELSKMFAEFRTNLERMGIGYDQYLTHIKKGEEDLRKEWKPEAEKRARMQLLLRQIAQNENLKAPEEMVKKEVDLILKKYKEAEKTGAESFVRNMLLNEEVWKFLEEQK